MLRQVGSGYVLFSYVLLRCGRFDQFSRVAFCSDVLRSGRCVVMRWVQFSSVRSRCVLVGQISCVVLR